MAMLQNAPFVLLDNVVELIHKKMPTKDAVLVENFARILYGTLARSEFSQRSESDLYGATLNLWNTLNQTPKGDFQNYVYNPVQQKHGWQSSHTVIEMVQQDMPFLVDSVSMALNRFGITAHLMIHTPLAIQRDGKGRISAVRHVLESEAGDERVAVFLVEIESLQDEERMAALSEELDSVLQDITAAVKDWQPMQNKLVEVIEGVKAESVPGHPSERQDAIDFLEFLRNHQFTLLGYRHYDLERVEGDMALVANEPSSLGIMKIRSTHHQSMLISTLTEVARKQALSSDDHLILTKTNSKSRVHRPAYIDYVGIKRFNDEGKVIGEDRFIGLYASSVYNRSPREIPVINRKLERVVARSGLAPRSHDYKALMNILETYPRDELIQANEQQLTETAMGILHLQDRDKVRLFVRRDPFGRFFSALVYTSKERYNTQLRIKTQQLLAQHFNTEHEVEFTTYFSESTLARTHYLIKVEDNNMDIDVNELESNLVELARSWEDKLDTALLESQGEALGKSLSRRYVNAFPRSYKEDVLPSAAVVDIDHLEKLETENELGMLFYQPQENVLDGKQVCLKLFHKNEPIHLSDVLPMLENFGLRVIGERPYQVVTNEGKEYWILDFSMTLKGEINESIGSYQSRFQDALARVWRGEYEDDGFNHLVLSADLTGREVTLLRAFAKYMRQIGSTFSQEYIAETLDKYPHIAQLLVAMFRRRFDPRSKSKRELDKQLAQVETYLDDVANLDDDRIIRRYVELIEATLRTNFFQPDANGGDKDYIAFKVLPEMIPEMPLPLPKYEIFVYSPRMEGVHLRGGKVARGGLRWSDRREDFRTEVLGLVKAQQVKNTVIVPSGAKGGFVCKHLPTERDAFLAEGQACYRMFIRALLDVTDNIVQGELVPPAHVVRHDDDDSYLVVAADKGTATFSDIANSISEEYNFWLGDAFASGGQFGYDHKKMGITARGAWESVKRHFREMDIDCQSTDFTCIAVGDMAGDVFGNGMLLSRHIRLQAAFNHMHIFIDPDPVAESSFVERERLFNLPRSSWEDYNKTLISEGGGIFPRSAKSIKLSPQMKAMLDTSKNQMPPNDLIQTILKMEVDLLWNGGIGTYVKGSGETHIEVGDRANDAVRINGMDLKAKVVGEGGNLGLTQLGRIEYAKAGGRINTDFVDNVGGVDCSDNEVNIKILLNRLVAEGEMTVKQRNQTLEAMTDEVAEIVLEDCRNQTLTISVTETRNGEQLKEQIRFIHFLEKEGKLDRALEFLPNDDEMSERLAAGQGLTRPELSVLVAYAKMVLKESLLDPQVTEEATLAQLLVSYFPVRLQEKYQDWMTAHPLRGEIIATSLANEIVNNMGLNFMQRMQDETGGTVAEVALSYSIAAQVFAFDEIKAKIIGLDGTIPSVDQHGMLDHLQRTVRRATRWFLRRGTTNLDVASTVAFFRPVVEELNAGFDMLLASDESRQLAEQAQHLAEQGVPLELANNVVRLSTLFSALDLAEIAQQDVKPVSLVAETYFHLGNRIELHWFLDQINAQPVGNHWQAMARAGFREELDWLQRRLTLVVLRNCGAVCSAEGIIEQWVTDNAITLDRWLHMMAEFRTTKSHEFSKFSVALRELNLLILRCDNVAEPA